MMTTNQEQLPFDARPSQSLPKRTPAESDSGEAVFNLKNPLTTAPVKKDRPPSKKQAALAKID